MATMDPVNEALSSPIPEDPMPTNSSHSENNGILDDELLQHVSNGDPTAPEPEPNHTGAHKFLKGKETVGKALSERSGKLTLLELPVDILRLIVQEVHNLTRRPNRRSTTNSRVLQVPHTNDLASLALVNSTLHSLAVPHIYSRFDVIWPDSQSPPSDTKNVDALTYGLSTLCLGSKFVHRVNKMRNNNTPGARQYKVDHDYTKYIRKFSLGNGPEDWVSEYNIFKEGGKMLGTLVALAVEKMVNLEAFVWDMPTGVLSDVFLALAAPQDGATDHESKLDRVWIRLHDSSFSQDASQSPNRSIGHSNAMPDGTTLTAIGFLPPHDDLDQPDPPVPLSYGQSPVEYPTFSVLPPLRNLTVLEIDDLSYLDELSMLIGRSQSRLQELRIGIAAKAANLGFIQAWDGPDLQQVDKSAHWPGASKIGPRRLGGVLGVLLGRVLDLRHRRATTEPLQNNTLVVTMPIPQGSATGLATASQESSPPDTNGETASLQPSGVPVVESCQPRVGTDTPPSHDTDDIHQKLDGKLRLRVLELERVPLSMQVILKGVDWSVLTTLTLLNCPHQITLWKVLARHFMPTSSIPGLKGASAIQNAHNSSLQYHLALKHIHTDVTSLPLIKFIKETLAPNTLEVLLLHDRHRVLLPQVPLHKVFGLAVARHCKSLRKLLFDSSEDTPHFMTTSENTRWLHWALSTDMVLYLTSGKLPQLRELSVALVARDWVSLPWETPAVVFPMRIILANISASIPSFGGSQTSRT
ncbi:hypothetical protein IMZ48_38140 [Candidatus Bathyarchaeota archaeon]|nr:hypothetical protein [Candidatus Bathyarchaeota archaeon]